MSYEISITRKSWKKVYHIEPLGFLLYPLEVLLLTIIALDGFRMDQHQGPIWSELK